MISSRPPPTSLRPPPTSLARPRRPPTTDPFADPPRTRPIEHPLVFQTVRRRAAVPRDSPPPSESVGLLWYDAREEFVRPPWQEVEEAYAAANRRRRERMVVAGTQTSTAEHGTAAVTQTDAPDLGASAGTQTESSALGVSLACTQTDSGTGSGFSASTQTDPEPPAQSPIGPTVAAAQAPVLLAPKQKKKDARAAKAEKRLARIESLLLEMTASAAATAAALAPAAPVAPPLPPTVAPQVPVLALEQQKDARVIKAERRCEKLESLLRKMTIAAAAAPPPPSTSGSSSSSSSPLSCERLMQLDIMAKSQALARQHFISRVSEAWAQSPSLPPPAPLVARATRPCPRNWLGLSDLLGALPSFPPPPPVPASAPVPGAVDEVLRCSSASSALVLWRGHRMSPGLPGPVSVAAAMLAVLRRVSDVCAEGKRDEYTGEAPARQLVRYQEAGYYRSRTLFGRFLKAVARREARDARERSRQPPRSPAYRVVVDVASGGGHGAVGPDRSQLRLVSEFVWRLFQDQERRFVYLGRVESDSALDLLVLGTGNTEEEEALALAVGTPLPDEDWPVVLYTGTSPAVGRVQAGEGRAVATQLLLTWPYDASSAEQGSLGCVETSRVEEFDSELDLPVGNGDEEEEALALAADTPLPDEDWPLVLYTSSVPPVGVAQAGEGAVATPLLLTWPYETEVVVQGSSALLEVVDLVEGSPSDSPRPSDSSVDCELMDTADETFVSEAQEESEVVGAAEEPAEAPMPDAPAEAPAEWDEELPEAPAPVLDEPMTDSSTADSHDTAAHAYTADVSQTAVLFSARPAETSQTADPQTAENTRAADIEMADASTAPEAPIPAADDSMAMDEDDLGPMGYGERTLAKPRRRRRALVPGPSAPVTLFAESALYSKGPLSSTVPGVATAGLPISSPDIEMTEASVPPCDADRGSKPGIFGTPKPFFFAPRAAGTLRVPEVLGKAKNVRQRGAFTRVELAPEVPVERSPTPPALTPAPAPTQPEAAQVYCRPPGTIPEVGGGSKKARRRRRKAKDQALAEEESTEGAEEPAVEEAVAVVQEAAEPALVTDDPRPKYVARLAPRAERHALRAQRAAERPAEGWPVGHPGWLDDLRASGVIITMEQWRMVADWKDQDMARKAAEKAAEKAAKEAEAAAGTVGESAEQCAPPEEAPVEPQHPPVLASSGVEGRRIAPVSRRRGVRRVVNVAREEGGAQPEGAALAGSLPMTNPGPPGTAQPTGGDFGEARFPPLLDLSQEGDGGGGGWRGRREGDFGGGQEGPAYSRWVRVAGAYEKSEERLTSWYPICGPHTGASTLGAYQNRLPNAVRSGTLGLASSLSASISRTPGKGEGDVKGVKEEVGRDGGSSLLPLGVWRAEYDYQRKAGIPFVDRTPVHPHLGPTKTGSRMLLTSWYPICGPHTGASTLGAYQNRLPNAVRSGTLGLASPLSASISRTPGKGEGDVKGVKEEVARDGGSSLLPLGVLRVGDELSETDNPGVSRMDRTPVHPYLGKPRKTAPECCNVADSGPGKPSVQHCLGDKWDHYAWETGAKWDLGPPGAAA
ncbi:uncharacterized protein H6S33_010811 [Morchella sextelata]|uniref:uncharacterized protein n=1 Tax=Morchella sextelata TaxID=1174677 RepID=UPI001D03FE77|nr:uncharacterized protein H6S33_010811 [Morchella sextelata]KAH0611546.1 hypothetical protein H6S33_010811 [Morchella sextelata]